MWADKPDEGLAWAAEMRSKHRASPPALGFHLVMGPEFAEMATNLGRNLQENRVRLVQAVFEARAGRPERPG